MRASFIFAILIAPLVATNFSKASAHPLNMKRAHHSCHSYRGHRGGASSGVGEIVSDAGDIVGGGVTGATGGKLGGAGGIIDTASRIAGGVFGGGGSSSGIL